MANPWFKFYGSEYLSDPKILQLDPDERSCWVTILCLASQSDGSIRFLSEAQLLAMSGITKQRENVLKKFEQLDMILICNGTVTVKNWEKRQYSEGYSRVKKFRERKSNAKDNDRKIRTDKIRTEQIYTTFETFWKEYPNKKAKPKAYQSWVKINPDENLLKQILDGLEKAKQSTQWQKDNGQFIPHPTTWLNQERWNDEVEIIKNKSEKF